MDGIFARNQFPHRFLLIRRSVKPRKPDEWHAERAAVLELEPDLVGVKADVENARAQLRHSANRSTHASSSVVVHDCRAQSTQFDAARGLKPRRIGPARRVQARTSPGQ